MKTGKAGEFRVVSELLLRGFQPSMTIEINEADIILDNGIKIQVKTSHLSDKGYYAFSFKWWKLNENGKRKQLKHPLCNIDFVILWAIEANDFFIIPVNKIRERDSYTLNYHPHGKRKSKVIELLKNHLNQWDLLWSRR